MVILRFSTSDWNFFILWCGDFSLKVGGVCFDLLTEFLL